MAEKDNSKTGTFIAGIIGGIASKLTGNGFFEGFSAGATVYENKDNITKVWNDAHKGMADNQSMVLDMYKGDAESFDSLDRCSIFNIMLAENN